MVGSTFPRGFLIRELRFSLGGVITGRGALAPPRSDVASAPGAGSPAGEDRGAAGSGGWGLDFSFGTWLTRPVLPGIHPAVGIRPAPGHPSAVGRSPRAMPSCYGNLTKTRFCFHFPPVLSVIVQKASI